MTRKEIVNHLIDIYVAKNKDYGNSAHLTYVEFGEVALVIRISDKLSRLRTLMLSGEQNVKDESIADTIGDAVTYLCMLAAEVNCDIPDIPDTERMTMSENIEETVNYLELLIDDDIKCVVPVDDMGYYREMLIAIWKGIADPEVRIDEYLNLAGMLLAELEWRVSKK